MSDEITRGGGGRRYCRQTCSFSPARRSRVIHSHPKRSRELERAGPGTAGVPLEGQRVHGGAAERGMDSGLQAPRATASHACSLQKQLQPLSSKETQSRLKLRAIRASRGLTAWLTKSRPSFHGDRRCFLMRRPFPAQWPGPRPIAPASPCIDCFRPVTSTTTSAHANMAWPCCPPLPLFSPSASALPRLP